MTKPSLLLTRPIRQSQDFAARLNPATTEGVEIVHSPLIEIVPTGDAPDLGRYAGVIFTSAQAVELAPDPLNRAAFCVGERTATAARDRGWQVLLVCQTAQALVAQMDVGAGGPLLHLAGRHRRGAVAERLTAAGLRTDVHTLYDQRPRDLTPEARQMLARGGPVVLPLFSPRSATQFADQVSAAGNVVAVALSAAVAEALGGIPLSRLIIVSAPTSDDMMQGVEMALASATFP